MSGAVAGWVEGWSLSLHGVLEPHPMPVASPCDHSMKFLQQRLTSYLTAQGLLRHTSGSFQAFLRLLKAQNWHGVTSSMFCWLKQDVGAA